MIGYFALFLFLFFVFFLFYFFVFFVFLFFLFYILLLRLLLLYCLYVCIHVCMFTSMCISPQTWVTHMYKMSNIWNLNYSDGNDNGFVINPITMIVVITLINSLVRRFCLYVSVRVITTILAIIVISKHYRYYVFYSYFPCCLNCFIVFFFYYCSYLLPYHIGLSDLITK